MDYKMMAEIASVLVETAKKFKDLGIPEKPYNLKFQINSTKYAGQVCWEHLGAVPEVSFNLALLSKATAADRRQTAIHELCHVYAGTCQGHGPVWKALMRAVDTQPEIYHSMSRLSRQELRDYYRRS